MELHCFKIVGVIGIGVVVKGGGEEEEKGLVVVWSESNRLEFNGRQRKSMLTGDVAGAGGGRHQQLNKRCYLGATVYVMVLAFATVDASFIL